MGAKQPYGAQSAVVLALDGHVAPALAQKAAPIEWVASAHRSGAHIDPGTTGTHAPLPLHVCVQSPAPHSR